MREGAGRVRTGVLLLYVALSIGLAATAMEVFWPEWSEEPPPPVPDALFGLLLYGTLLALLGRLAHRRGTGLRALLGDAPDSQRLRWALQCGAALVGVSLLSIHLVFLPLSYSHPEFVQWWLIDDPAIVIWTQGESFQLANAINFGVVVLLAPAAEELLFRGLLLPAWAARLGETRAVVASSALFAVLHLDVLGSFVFGLVAGVTFLRAGGLWLPILVHVTNNVLAWFLLLGELSIYGAAGPGLQDFRASWWLGAVGLVLGCPLLAVVVRAMPRTGTASGAGT
jgi:membrane protease YdiL (CAAX protease family)